MLWRIFDLTSKPPQTFVSKNKNLLTHPTTKLNAEGIGTRYGERVRSRMRKLSI